MNGLVGKEAKARNGTSVDTGYCTGTSVFSILIDSIRRAHEIISQRKKIIISLFFFFLHFLHFCLFSQRKAEKY